MALSRVVANLLVLSALGFAVAAKADDVAATPRERLERATAASSLEDLNAKPWHVKIAMTLFDSKGNNPVEGTIDYWKSGDESLRITTVGPNIETRLTHDGHTYHGVSGAEVPYLADVVFNEFMHPGPRAYDFEGTTPEIRKEKFGKVPLDCIMLTQVLKRVNQTPLGLFPTYCIDVDADRLRASFDFGSQGMIANKVGRFLDHDVVMELAIAEQTTTVATAKVLSMSTFSPTPDTFLPGTQLAPVKDRSARIASGIIAGLKLGGAVPVYPVEAKQDHISGTVTMHAIIGRDGHIHILRVITAPDPSLAISALAAVRTWTYKPYLLNGEPTEVDTTIIVNYNLNY